MKRNVAVATILTSPYIPEAKSVESVLPNPIERKTSGA